MSLRLIFGPMFSSKTTTLVGLLNNYASTGENRVLYVNHVWDTRQSQDGFISTHNSELRVTNISKCKVEHLAEINYQDYDVLGVDEGQFFTDLVEVVREWLFNEKIVLVAGLDGDYRMEIFGRMNELLCCADQVSKLYAFCQECAKNGHVDVKAPFTHRLVPQEGQIKVGSAETYQALCRKCFHNKKHE